MINTRGIYQERQWIFKPTSHYRVKCKLRLISNEDIMRLIIDVKASVKAGEEVFLVYGDPKEKSDEKSSFLEGTIKRKCDFIIYSLLKSKV